MRLKTLARLLATILTAQAATLPQTPTQIYNVVYTMLPGQNIVQFAGTMRVPHLPHQGFYYLWPGLFLPDFGGVLQPVLSGGTGQWSINNTWYYAITEDPAGQQDVQYVAFGVDEGDDVRFNMQKNDTWSITLTVPGTTKEATNSFPKIGMFLNGLALPPQLLTYKHAQPLRKQTTSRTRSLKLSFGARSGISVPSISPTLRL
jgi:hypothetical protein